MPSQQVACWRGPMGENGMGFFLEQFVYQIVYEDFKDG